MVRKQRRPLNADADAGHGLAPPISPRQHNDTFDTPYLRILSTSS